jgi:predicted NUDIX family phosphoesterase
MAKKSENSIVSEPMGRVEWTEKTPPRQFAMLPYGPYNLAKRSPVFTLPEQYQPKGVVVVLVDTEQILVVPTKLFHKMGLFQGFSTEVDRFLPAFFASGALSYRPRSEMEEDPSFKQLIPYVLFRHTSDDGGVSLFQYSRGKGQGEARLHAKRSVGVGGHISSIDADVVRSLRAEAVYHEGMRRELEEEVLVDTPYRDRCVGLINDDSTEVGQVHLGIVHLCEVDLPQIEPREEDILDAGFRPIDQIIRDLDRVETWSQIAVRALFA